MPKTTFAALLIRRSCCSAPTLGIGENADRLQTHTQAGPRAPDGCFFSLREKHEARKAAERVDGVRKVQQAPGDTPDERQRTRRRRGVVDVTNEIELEGTVSSWPEHDEAVSTAWAAPGVHRVDDRINVLN